MDRRNPNDEGMKARSSGGGSLLAGLMIGGLVGAGAMLLFAPQAGRETRAAVRDGAMELKDRTTDTVQKTVSQAKSRAQDMADQVRGKASDLQAQGREIAIDQLDRVSTAAQAGKKSLQNSRSNT